MLSNCDKNQFQVNYCNIKYTVTFDGKCWPLCLIINQIGLCEVWRTQYLYHGGVILILLQLIVTKLRLDEIVWCHAQ